MNTTYYFWLAGFVSLGVACITAHLRKSPQRMHVTHAYLLFAFVFVVIFGYKSFELRKDSNLAVTEAETASLKLKYATSIVAFSHAFSQDLKKGSDIDKNVKSTLQSALDTLEKDKEKSTSQKPDLELDCKIIIVKAEQKLAVKDDIEKMAASDPERARLLKAVLQDKSLSKKEAESLKPLIETKIPTGWYNDVFDLEWTKALGDKKKHQEKLESFYEHYFWYLMRIAIFFAFLALVTLVGIITVGLQLFLLGRNSSRVNDVLNDHVVWSWQTVAATLLTWLSFTFLSSPILKGLSLSATQGEKSALILALSTMGLYLLQNLPALLLVYFLAIKPGGMKLGSDQFKEAFCITWKTPKRGAFGLIVMGFLTWASCFPFVLLSSWAASGFGSHMSSNPIISEVVSSVKDMSVFAVLAFTLTLGIIPALVEELLFRGFVYISLRKYLGAFLGILLSAGLFSIVHMDQGSMLQLFSLGFVFAYAVEKNQSLIPSMVAHCLWNLTAFTMLLMMYS
ncbi:MAG: CPBP family intramembrane metalloprotease [Candidatus Melainabacteria bacterium]|nr:MAG: CPBP family intramembrane metalloprotease [Candidatus Melainabacteria bacterium]